MSLTQERINEIIWECWNEVAKEGKVTPLFTIPPATIDRKPDFYLDPDTGRVEDWQDTGWLPCYIHFPPANEVYKEKYRLLSAQHVRDVEQLESDCKELVEALERTWEIIDAAKLHNLVNGVQFGQIAWLIKMEEAKEESLRALAKHKASMGEK